MPIPIQNPRPCSCRGPSAISILLILALAGTALPLEAKERGVKAVLSLCADATKEGGIAHIASDENEGRFARIDSRVSMGFREEALWFRIDLPPAANMPPAAEYRIFLRSTYIDDIKAYVFSSSSAGPSDLAEKNFEYGIAGYSLDPGVRAARIYFRVASDAPVKFEALVSGSSGGPVGHYLFIGLFLGFFFVFFLTALLFCVSDGDAALSGRIALAVYIACAILYVAASSGLGWHFLWKGNAFFEKRAAPLCTCAVIFFALVLARSVLALKQRAPAFDIAFLVLQILSPAVMVGLFLIDYRAIMNLGGILVLISMAAIIAACGYGVLKRWRQSYFLLPAFLAFALGAAAAQGITFGAFAKIQELNPEYWGFAIQVCLLSIGYRDALGALRAGKLKAAKLGRVVLAERTRGDAKMGFFSAFSHEIKNPLALIDASLQAVGRGEYGKSVPSDHRAFSLMRKNLHRLERLVDGALDVIEIEEGKRKASPETVDLGAAVALFASEFKSGFQSKDVEFTAEAPAGIEGCVDRRHFEIIAYNLIANALRRAPEGSAIRLHLKMDGDAVALEISDSGRRIDASTRESVFDLYRTDFDGSATGNEDTFIGLCQARQLARLNSGELSLSPSNPEGETFLLRLPAATQKCGERPAPSSEPESEKLSAYRPEPPEHRAKGENADAARRSEAPTHGKAIKAGQRRILVVEDAPDLLEFLAEALGKDFVIDTATNGSQALSLLKEGQLPDLIVSDVMMPIMDGTALLARLKADDRLASIPLIFLTARNQAQDRIKSIQGGAVGYISKPFFYEELKAAVDNILAVREGGIRDAERRVIEAIHGGLDNFPQPREIDVERAMEAFGFTKQEREVAVLVATGKSDKEIAGVLGLSSRTVSNYVSRLLKKADASSRTELTARLSG
jgi:DNA-binding NarL/FixJ family response regulator/signal transduction histidine kinase